MTAVTTIARIIAFVSGVLLIFYVLFSYEDEERKIKNWFDAAWIVVQTKEEKSASTLRIFLQKLLGGLNSVLARMYGLSPFSMRAYSGGLCFSIVPHFSLFAALAANEGSTGLAIVFSVIIAIALCCGLSKRPKRRNICAVVIVILYFGLCFHAINTRQEINKHGLPEYIFLLTLTSVLLLESLLFGIIRLLFIAAATRRSLRSTLLFIFVATCATPMLALTLTYLIMIAVHAALSGEKIFIFFTVNLAFFAAPTLMSVSFLVVLIIAISIRLIYAMLPRFIYAPIKLQVLENRKGAFWFGVFLISVAQPHIGPYIEKIAKPLGF